MEWVEVTGKTVEQAKEHALDQLGVHEEEAEFEVLEEPRPGLFGRLRSEARVRARVMPSVPRPKLDRRDRNRRGRRRDERPAPNGPASGSGDADESSSGSDSAGGSRRSGKSGGGSGGGERKRRGQQHNPGEDGMVLNDTGDDVAGEGEDADEVEVATEFLSGLLEAFGAPYTLQERELEDDFVELSVQGEGLGVLIGPRGQTLAAVQELTRTVVQRRSRGRAGRIVLDIAGYRQARRAALERFAREVASQVTASGVPRVLEPMPPADRKVVHDTINVIDGVTTGSEGEEPRRRVVVSPQPQGG